MKLGTYVRKKEDAGRLGIIHENLVFDAEKLGQVLSIPLPNNMLDLIEMGLPTVEFLENLLQEKNSKKHFVGTFFPLSNALFLAPIPKPKKNIFGIGLNYTEHVAESARTLDTAKELPQRCVIFSKPTTAVIGNGDAIVHNARITQQLDWEGELAVIIGSRASRVKKNHALDHVFGYSIINDVSARDCRRSGQWIVSKGQDTFAPMGPFLVTANELTDPHNLNIRTTVNGVEKQNSNTKFMLFKIDEIIEDISEGMTLESGDIIATGTPAGVGAGRNPQEWMWPGDRVEIHIEKIGTLSNPIVKSL